MKQNGWTDRWIQFNVLFMTRKEPKCLDDGSMELKVLFRIRNDPKWLNVCMDAV